MVERLLKNSDSSDFFNDRIEENNDLRIDFFSKFFSRIFINSRERVRITSIFLTFKRSLFKSVE